MQLALDANASLMREHDVFDDRQAKASPSGLTRARFIDAIKTLKEPRKMFRRDTGTEIADVKFGSELRFLHADRDLVALAGVLQRVVNQIGKDLMDGLGIGGNHRVRGVVKHEFHVTTARNSREALQGVFEQLGSRRWMHDEPLLS